MPKGGSVITKAIICSALILGSVGTVVVQSRFETIPIPKPSETPIEEPTDQPSEPTEVPQEPEPAGNPYQVVQRGSASQQPPQEATQTTQEQPEQPASDNGYKVINAHR